MDRELVERLAREAGIDVDADTLCRHEGWRDPMERFAALVAEECAKLAAAVPDRSGRNADGNGWIQRATPCDAAVAIRAKFRP